MGKRFENKPFEGLSSNIIHSGADDNAPQSQTYEEARDNCKSVLENRFNRIPEGCEFTSRLEGVNKISIVTPEDDSHAYAVLFYEGTSKGDEPVERNTTLSIFTTGDLSGKLPKELSHLSRADILNEVLLDLKSVGLDHPFFRWHSLDDDELEIIAPGDWDMSEQEEGQGEPRSRVPIDPERLNFFVQHPDVLMGVTPGKLTRVRYGKAGRFGTGTPRAFFSDYHAVVLPRGIMFENAACENAIYYETFDDETLPEGRIPEEIIEKIRSGEMTVEERKALLAKIGFHAMRQKDKKELSAKGQRYPRIHPGIGAPDSQRKRFYDDLNAFIATNLA